MHKLRHTGTYDEYESRFEELKAFIVHSRCGDFDKDYWITAFVSGLDKDIQAGLDMLHPNSLDSAIHLGRQQVHLNDSLMRKLKEFTRGMSVSNQARKSEIKPYQKSSQKAVQNTKSGFKLLTPLEMDQRRAKGLCYNCDE